MDIKQKLFYLIDINANISTELDFP